MVYHDRLTTIPVGRRILKSMQNNKIWKVQATFSVGEGCRVVFEATFLDFRIARDMGLVRYTYSHCFDGQSGFQATYCTV